MTDINDLTTLADFSKEVSITGQTLAAWITSHNDLRENSFDGEGSIFPVKKFGNTNVYDRKQLLELTAEKGNSHAVKAAGYVHPDKFAELERNYLEAIGRIGTLEMDVAHADTLADRLAAMEIERDHFERENSKNMETVDLLAGQLDAAQSAVLSLSE